MDVMWWMMSRTTRVYEYYQHQKLQIDVCRRGKTQLIRKCSSSWTHILYIFIVGGGVPRSSNTHEEIDIWRSKIGFKVPAAYP